MLKKKIKYVDFNGNEREEDFYFHLSKAEIVEMELSVWGGLSSQIEKIVAEQEPKKLVELFKSLVLNSYGEKSPDGRRFIKNQELRDAFSQTEAYSILFMELSQNADAAAAFVNGIVPTE